MRLEGADCRRYSPQFELENARYSAAFDQRVATSRESGRERFARWPAIWRGDKEEQHREDDMERHHHLSEMLTSVRGQDAANAYFFLGHRFLPPLQRVRGAPARKCV